MYKLVLKKGNNYIKSEADWFKYVPPKKNNHWRHEVTIKMLAEYFIAAKGYIPKEIEDILISVKMISRFLLSQKLLLYLILKE